MRNPLRSEAEAFRFVVVAVIGAVVIVGASYLNMWVGVVAAVVVVGGILWWLLGGDLGGRRPVVVSDRVEGRHRVILLAPPGTTEVDLGEAATDVVVVVPALASPVEALTGAVDDRRADAAETASLLAEQLPNARGEIGADDPVQAIDDALRVHGADEIVIVGADDELLERVRERFAVDVRRA